MPEFHAHASGHIKASPESVYAIFADYRVGHPAVLPRPPFTTLNVLEGGVGEGTKIEVGMSILGRERRIRGVVSEPEPGRVLAEIYDDPNIGTTTFTVERNEGGGTFLTLATRGQTTLGGFWGQIESFLTCWFLRWTYRKEIALVAARAAGS